MRRFLIITLAIAFIFSLCAVPVSAASYDLGSPSWWGSYALTPYDEDYEFHSLYFYDRDTDEVSASTGIDDTIGLAYFPNGNYLTNANNITTPYNWGFRWVSYSSLPEPLFTLRSTGYTIEKPVLGFQYTNSFVSNHSNLDKLFFPAIQYNNLFIPSSGQYLKVSFQFDSIQTNDIPSSLKYLMKPSNFAFLADVSSSGGIVQPYGLQFPATVTVNKISGRTYNYTFYFNISADSLSNVSGNLSLILRFPYFSGGRSLNYSGSNLQFLTNASIPTQYEILTIGGYDQELSNIQNAIITSNQQLVDLYTKESAEDITYVIQLQNSNSELDQSINDYQSANVVVDNIKDVFTTPPLNDMVENSFQSIDSGFDVKSLFSLPWLVSALSLVFSFCIIRLILYGTKEG